MANAVHTGYKPNRKPPDKAKINELRDPRTMISTENHQQLFDRLVAAGVRGIHNAPGAPKPKRSG